MWIACAHTRAQHVQVVQEKGGRRQPVQGHGHQAREHRHRGHPRCDAVVLSPGSNSPWPSLPLPPQLLVCTTNTRAQILERGSCWELAAHAFEGSAAGSVSNLVHWCQKLTWLPVRRHRHVQPRADCSAQELRDLPGPEDSQEGAPPARNWRSDAHPSSSAHAAES